MDGRNLHSRNDRKANDHRAALVKLGYLAERTYLVTNTTAESVKRIATMIANKRTPEPRMNFASFIVPDSNKMVVVITGYAEDMPALEELVGHLDVPDPTTE